MLRWGMETAVQAARIAVNKLIERGGYKNMTQAQLFDWEKTNKGEGEFRLQRWSLH